MKPEVFFLDIKTSCSLIKKLGSVFDQAFPNVIKDRDFTAVKLSFGELGSHGFVRPTFIREVIKKIKENGGRPFLTDSNTLYSGHRHNSVDHIENAIAHGFSFATVNAPIIIADGLLGHNFKEIKIDQKHFKTVKIGAEIVEADAIISVSHMTGHMCTGFGATLKNLGMGAASRAGKQQQHTGTKPKVNPTNCIACKKCGAVCPEDAFNYESGKAEIDYGKCVGCDECVTVCPTGAISINWADDQEFGIQERMAEYTLGVLKNKRAGFITFLTDITPDCDCFPQSDEPIVRNLGILVSTDPVAIDKAAFDLVQKEMGNVHSRLGKDQCDDKFKEIHGVDSSKIFDYAEKIGLGKKDYELVEVK